MHPSAKTNGKFFFDTYVAPMSEVTVVDIGAQDINGSLKEVCPNGAKYIGVDYEEGKGVDVVLDDPYSLPFDTESVDVVVSSSCFEHSEMFWVLFIEILRVLKPGGVFYLNVPSNGQFHRYPVDCWRFYPDSGNALISWAVRSGYKPALLESYISCQEQYGWNDFVAVFIKDSTYADRYQNRITNIHKSFYNGQVYGKEGFINFNELTEDMLKLGYISGIVNGKILLR